MHSHREGETHVHAGAVELNLGVDERLDPGEIDDLFEDLLGLVPGQAKDRRVEIDVFTASEILVEARPQFKECRQPSAASHRAGGGLKDASDHLEQRALARSVVPDKADRRSQVDIEIHVLQCPEVITMLA